MQTIVGINVGFGYGMVLTMAAGEEMCKPVKPVSALAWYARPQTKGFLS